MTDTDRTIPTLSLDDDPLDSLTIVELRVANGKLRADVAHAITTPTADRWDALALVGWLHAKRVDPRSRLEDWTALTAAELLRALDWTPPTKEDDDDQEEGETPPPATMNDVIEAAKQDPTVPTVAP